MPGHNMDFTTAVVTGGGGGERNATVDGQLVKGGDCRDRQGNVAMVHQSRQKG